MAPKQEKELIKLEGTIIERTDKMIKFQQNTSDVKAIYYLDEITSIDSENLRPTPVAETQPISEAQGWAVLHGAQSSNETQAFPEIKPFEDSQIPTDVYSSGETFAPIDVPDLRICFDSTNSRCVVEICL